jgi:hypothetical protein
MATFHYPLHIRWSSRGGPGGREAKLLVVGGRHEARCQRHDVHLAAVELQPLEMLPKPCPLHTKPAQVKSERDGILCHRKSCRGLYYRQAVAFNTSELLLQLRRCSPEQAFQSPFKWIPCGSHNANAGGWDLMLVAHILCMGNMATSCMC